MLLRGWRVPADTGEHRRIDAIDRAERCESVRKLLGGFDLLPELSRAGNYRGFTGVDIVGA